MSTTLQSTNPSNGVSVGEVPVTAISDIPAVVARARSAAVGWRDLGIDERCAILARIAPAILERATELAELLTSEMGKPVREALGEIKSCATGVEEELADIAEALAPDILDDGRTHSTIHHDPFGVCAAICPWNFPFAMPHWIVFPALAAGNAVILKPSEETPLIAQAYADLLIEVLPPNVLQVVHGADEQGRALVEADVDLIAFTGSRETGKKILTSASRDLKRVILELGGKDPMLVLDDADLAKAARFAAKNSFRNAGQVCVSTERIYVPKRVAESFVQLLVEESKAFKVGDGMDPDTSVGPMINQRQKSHVLAQIDQALTKGAALASGGQSLEGNFVQPTVLTGVTADMAIATEETFGPVACVIAVEDEDEAVRQANDTPFGLGAVVFGRDATRAGEVARKLTAGMIAINRPVGGGRGAPWVGARESGYGFHSSKDGHRQFTQTRLVTRPS